MKPPLGTWKKPHDCRLWCSRQLDRYRCGVLVNTKLSMYQQSALAAKKDYLILGCVKHGIRLRKGILHVYFTLKHCVQFGAPQYQRDTEVPEQAPWWATMLVWAWSTGCLRRDCKSWA